MAFAPFEEAFRYSVPGRMDTYRAIRRVMGATISMTFCGYLSDCFGGAPYTAARVEYRNSLQYRHMAFPMPAVRANAALN